MKKAGFIEGLIEKLDADNFRKIQDAKVAIAGSGGLGSNCALNLVRSGFSQLTLIDFDIVEASNLDRQFYFFDQIGMKKVDALKTNLLRINPCLKITAFDIRIDRDNIKEIFEECDVVAECLDRAEAKSMLVAELLKTGKFIVTASGLGGIGHSDDIKISYIKESLVVIGDLRSDVSTKPAFSPRVNVVAAKQADVILEHVVSGTKQRN